MNYHCGCEIDLCTIPVCDNKATVDMKTNAPIDGKYTLILNFLGTAKMYEQVFIAGSAIMFDLCNLNENYCYSGTIIDPVNTAVTDIKFCTQQMVVNDCQQTP